MYRREAVLFVKERGSDKAEGETEGDAASPQTLSGPEAKQFYEEVLSMPAESSPSTTNVSRALRKRKRSTAKRRAPSNKRTKQTVPVSRVFGYVQEGDQERVRAALSSGACDVNTTDQFHWTLLMSAAHAGHAHLVEYLLSEGAEWRGRVDRSGCSAVDLARKAGHVSLACFIESCNSTPSTREPFAGENKEAQSKTPRRRTRTYFCDVCQQRVAESSSTGGHTTSTTHQFSCQHRVRAGSSYTIPRSNRGFQMMLRSGWDPERGLGSEQEGRKYPVKTVLKQDRLGFGKTEEGLAQGKAKVTHFAAFDERAVKRRVERFERGKSFLKKKDIVAAARKDREWEIRMRRYMNGEDYGLS